MSASYVGCLMHVQIKGMFRGVCREFVCQRIEENVCMLGHGIAAERCYLRVTKGLMRRISSCMGSWARCPASCSFGATPPVLWQSQLLL